MGNGAASFESRRAVVARVLGLLREQGGAALSLDAIARRTECEAAGVAAALETLAEHGLVDRDAAGAWRVTADGVARSRP